MKKLGGKKDKAPKYFQLGTVVEGAKDFYAEDSTRRGKGTMMGELLADAEFQRYNKRKYNEIQKTRAENGRGGRHYRAGKSAAAKKRSKRQ